MSAQAFPPLASFLRHRWVSVALVAMVIAILARSIGQARWVEDGAAHASGLWLGAVCGAALAASRFRGRTALAYSLVLSAAAGGEVVGHILTAAVQASPPAEVIGLMHLRLLTLFDRIAGWGAAYFSGGAIHDTGLFVLLLTLTTWNASAWFVWCIARRQRAFEGLLPLGLLLAINVHLSGQPVDGLWLFIMCAVLLMARTAFTQGCDDWERRRVDYPDELGPTWSGSALAMALVVSLLARAAPFVGTREGWQFLSDVFRVSEQQTAERLFAGVNTPQAKAAALARTPNLALIGQPPDQGPETIMWVWLSDPAPPPPEAHTSATNTRQHYWRSTIFATYQGTGWAPVLPEAPQHLAPPSNSPPGRYALQQHFEIVAPHSDVLFAVNAPVTATNGVRVSPAPGLDATMLQGTASVYDVASWATAVTEAQLAAEPSAYPADLAKIYLQLPPSLPQRVRNLAARVTEGAATPYDKAVRLQDYLRATYSYRLDVPPPPQGRDAVDYFLFEAPGGFCSYYASAMAVMLRAEGVPARVVTGYAMGDYDFARGAYRVPAGASHAWVEVYFPHYGWVEFEPTAARSPFAYPPGETPLPTPAVAPSPTPPRVGRLWKAIIWAAGMLGLLGLMSAVWWWMSRPDKSTPARRTPRGQMWALYRSVRLALARAGLDAPPSTTPDEFLSTHASVLAERPRLFEAVARATALYVVATFSPREVTEAETQTAHRLWRRAAPEWLELWLKTGARPAQRFRAKG